VDDESAVSALLQVALLALSDPWSEVEFEYAADMAALVAARTSERPLFRLLDAADPSTRAFALRGLGSLAGVLGAIEVRDQGRRAALLPEVVSRCGAGLAERDRLPFDQALDCLAAVPGPDAARHLVRLAIGPMGSSLRYRATLILREMRPPAEVARPLVSALQAPIPPAWSHADTQARGQICLILDAATTHADEWASDAARSALELLESRDPESHARCRALAARGPVQVQPGNSRATDATIGWNAVRAPVGSRTAARVE
jgi:hypothetical protein